MAKIKGLTIVNIRRHFQKLPETRESAFLQSLPGELKVLYNSAGIKSWTSLEKQNELYKYVAAFLFPDTAPDNQLVELGKIVAAYNFSGIYSIFLRIPTFDYAINRWVNIWHLHHDSGIPDYAKHADGIIDLYIRQCPELPRETRLLIKGTIIKVIELMGYKQNRVTHIEDDINNWTWVIEYKK